MESLNVKECILLELQKLLELHKLGSPRASRIEKKYQSSTPAKNGKYLLNVHKMEGAHLQCVNNQYAKFEYKVMNVVAVTEYTN